MGIKPVKWALRQAGPLTATQRLVLVELAEYADDDGTNAYPSAKTIAEEIQCTVRTVERALEHLRNNNWIEYGDQSKVARYENKPKVYRLNLTKSREDDSEPMDESTLNDIGGDNSATDVGGTQETDPTLAAKRTDGDVAEGVISTPSITPRTDAGVGGVPTLVSDNPPYTHQPSTNVDGGAGVLLSAGNPQPHHGENESPSVTNVEGGANRPTLVGTNYSPNNPPPQSRVWMPTEAAMKTARSSVTVLSINIHLTRYRVRKAEQGKAPSSAEWLRWLLEDEQKAVQAERAKALAEGRSKKKWFGVAGDE